MFATIGQVLLIQGPVVILGLIGTPLQVVVFSTSRTLARLGTSSANIFNYALTPEYSRLFGAASYFVKYYMLDGPDPDAAMLGSRSLARRRR